MKSKKFYSLFIALPFAFCFTAGAFGADDQELLDSNFLKERVRRVHGDLAVKPGGAWQASAEGKVGTWKWTDKGWKCAENSELSCKEDSPAAFRLWSQPKAWWDSWQPIKRLSIEVVVVPREGMGAVGTQVEASNAGDGSAVTEEAKSGISADSDANPQPAGGSSGGSTKTKAYEVWEWRDAKDQRLKIWVSMRDYRIERLEMDGQVNVLVWESKPGRTNLELNQLILEKDGRRISLARSK